MKKAGSTETERVIDALEGLTTATPVGPVTFRSEDHQSRSWPVRLLRRWRPAEARFQLPIRFLGVGDNVMPQSKIERVERITAWWSSTGATRYKFRRER